MSTPILYHGTTSVCSQKVRLGLAEIGLGYDSRLIDLQKGEQFAPDYVALNPNAVVPTLVDGDLVVIESSLILEYLDREHNGGALMPAARNDGVAARLWLLRCLAMHAAVNTLTFSTVMRARILASKTPEEIAAGIAKMPDPVAQQKRRDLFDRGLQSVHLSQALAQLDRAFGDMADALDPDGWLSGPAFGIADIALLSYVDRIDRLGFGGLWEDRGPIADWLSRMRARPSYDIAITAFIPEEAAQSMRASGAAHWPELRDLWGTART